MTSSSRARAFPILPLLAVLGSMVSLAIGTSIAKRIFPVLGPAGVTLLRAGTASVILAAVWRPWRRGIGRASGEASGSPIGRSIDRSIARGDWLTLVGYGASIGVMNLLFYEAVDRIPFGIAVAFEFCGPLVVALVASRRLLDITWVLLAVAGLALLLPIRQNIGRGLDPIGIGYALGAGACWAMYIVIGAHAGRRLHGGQATSVGMAVATLIVAPFGIVGGGAALLHLSPLLIGMIVGLMSGAIPYGLEMYALPRLPRRTFSIFLSMEPALASLAAWPLLGERLSASQALAVACVVTASIGSAANARRDEPPPPPTVD